MAKKKALDFNLDDLFDAFDIDSLDGYGGIFDDETETRVIKPRIAKPRKVAFRHHPRPILHDQSRHRHRHSREGQAMASGSGKHKRTNKLRAATSAKGRRGSKTSGKVSVNSKGYVVPGNFPF